MSVWFALKGSDIFWSIRIWAKNPAIYAQIPEKDQVWKRLKMQSYSISDFNMNRSWMNTTLPLLVFYVAYTPVY